jgi:hypothetical protein
MKAATLPRGRHVAVAGTTLVLVVLSGLDQQLFARQASRLGKTQTADLLARFFAADSKPLVQYRARRTLTASARGGRIHASMDVWTSLDPEHGFQYQIVSEEGSPIIRKKVLLAALEAERAAVSSGDREQAALTAANYEFLTVSPVPLNLVKVDVRPRRKHVMLVDGALFLEAESADLVRIEGELSRRPSIWTRNVRVLREYGRIGGVHVPVAMSSTADVLIVGISTFSMIYQYVEINRTPIEPHEFPALVGLLPERLTHTVILPTNAPAAGP